MAYEYAGLEAAYDLWGYEQAELDAAYEIALSAHEMAILRTSYEVVTSVLTSYERLITPVGYMTQVIGNQFPYWHAARAKPGGKTQRILNSLVGFELTKLMHDVRKVRANMFLSLADISEPSQVWVANRPVVKGKNTLSHNLLENSSLSFLAPYRLGPWGWADSLLTDSGSFDVRPGKGLFGYYAVQMTATNGQSVVLQQRNNLVFRPGQSLTATVWYAGMRPERDPAVSVRDAGPRLQLSIEHSDGTTTSQSVFLLDDTGGEWRKKSVTIALTKETHTVEVSVIVTDYKTQTVVVDIGGVQLEEGTKSRPWVEFENDQDRLYLTYDKESFTESTAWGDITYSRQKKIQIADETSWENLVDVVTPDRTSVVVATTETGVAKVVLDACVDESGFQYSVGWRITSNQVERYNADNNMSEVYSSLDIFDLYGNAGREALLFDPGDLGVTQTLEALTVAGEWVYVVVKEVYLGRTQRVLKICSPYMPWDNQRLECIRDVYLDDGTGTCNSIGVIDGRKDSLLMDIDSTDYVVTLIWDRAAITPQGHVLFRNDPGTAKLVS